MQEYIKDITLEILNVQLFFLKSFNEHFAFLIKLKFLENFVMLLLSVFKSINTNFISKISSSHFSIMWRKNAKICKEAPDKHTYTLNALKF